jgi:hypothetical protein
MTGLARVATILAVALLSGGSASAQQPATPAAPAAAPQAAAAAPASTPAVASVKATNGKVLLNRAAAYDPATKDQRLLVGDRLVVLEGGAITLRFDGGCEQTIDVATVYTVPAAPPCGVAAADRGMRAPVQTTAAAAEVASGEYLKWGLIGLGVITPLILLSNSDSGKPISP